MDRTQTDKTLARIAATLLSLALLAELAAARSVAIRYLLLWLLRPAEAVARDFLLDYDPFAGTFLPLATNAGDDSRTQALRLANCLRTIALLIESLPSDQIYDWEPIMGYAAFLGRVVCEVARLQPASRPQRHGTICPDTS